MTDTITHVVELEVHTTIGGLSYNTLLRCDDFESLNLSLVYNSRGSCSVSLPDSHRLIPAVAKRSSMASVYVDGVKVYTGRIENQRFPLVPGSGSVTFDITDSWCLLDRTLAWPNPVPSGRVTLYNNDGTVVRRRVSPWTTGALAVTSSTDRAQAGIPSDLPLDTDWNSIYDSAAPLTDLDYWGMESEAGTNKLERGYWSLRMDMNRIGEFRYQESGFIYHLIDMNLRRRLGLRVNIGLSADFDPYMGRFMIFENQWAGGTIDPAVYRKAPNLRFDSIGEAIEVFLAGSPDEAIRFDFEFDARDGTYGMKFSTPNDLTNRPIDPSDGSVVGGEIVLAEAPTTHVAIGGNGDMQDRAFRQAVNYSSEMWVDEVFLDATNSQPIWGDGVTDRYRIPKYHSVNGGNSLDQRSSYQSNLQAAGEKRIIEDRHLDGIEAKLIETPWFHYAPDQTLQPSTFNIGTKVAISTPYAGTLTERIRRIDIDASAGSGVTITPHIGAVSTGADFDVSRRISAVSDRTGRIERR